MLIHKLVMENFGLFRDRNELDLAPRSVQGKTKPVILIGGKNGAGKTTMLEAIRLCLYGPRALGDRVSNREYENYLRGRVHRDDAALLQPDVSAVALVFEYAESGRRQRYEVERSWEIRTNSVESRLRILRDGEPLDDLDRASADDFLRDLVPPGVSQLYFFDGEKIQQLAETEEDDLALAEAVRGLLGLDLVERLENDLRIYATRLDSAPSVEPLKKQLKKIVKDRQVLEQRRLTAVRELDMSTCRLDEFRQKLALREQKLLKEGGAFAQKFEALKAEKTLLLQSVRDAEETIRELCEGLLPFVLATPLCQELQSQLVAEDTLQAWHAQARLLNRRVTALKGSLPKQLFPSKCALDAQMRKDIVSRVEHLLDRLAEPAEDLPDVSMIHSLSAEQHIRLSGAIDRIQKDVPTDLRAADAQLEKATRRLAQVEQDLNKVPAEDQLQPLLDELKVLHQALTKAAAAVERDQATVHDIDQQITQLTRQERSLNDQLARAEKGLDRQAMVARVRNVLDEYSHSLTASKTEELGATVARRFAQLWRKGDVIRRIEIDPASFQVRLFDRHDRVIPKRQLSAGEKQMYAISLLWGLAEVSGRPLPVVIDTPLGRLDEDHRGHLVQRYFPHASHQVIVLSTDTEIDQVYFSELSNAVSHAFHVRYDIAQGRSVVEKGYFWKDAKKDLTHAD